MIIVGAKLALAVALSLLHHGSINTQSYGRFG